MKRKQFIKYGGLLAGSLLLPASSADEDHPTPESLVKKSLDEKMEEIEELTKENKEVRKRLTVLKEDRETLSSLIIDDLNRMDFSGHPFYPRIRVFEPYLDAAIEQYRNIFPVDKLMMIEMAEVESGLGRKVISRAGAAGLFQFIPETGRRMGLHIEKDEDYDRASHIRPRRQALQQRMKHELRSLEKRIRRSIKGHSFPDRESFLAHLKKGGKNARWYTQGWQKLEDDALKLAALQNEEHDSLQRYRRHLYLLKHLPEKKRDSYDERFNPEKSTVAAVHYVAILLKRAKGNYMEMLSMYHADDTYLGIKPLEINVKHIERTVSLYLRRKARLLKANYGMIVRTSPTIEPMKKRLM
ncbi:MAG: transglycosylase SLT domain-containing protein [DPANN group archaeon]|nr:transglycosylase SLT domain-containing protein [DPANN group archaeon]